MQMERWVRTVERKCVELTRTNRLLRAALEKKDKVGAGGENGARFSGLRVLRGLAPWRGSLWGDNDQALAESCTREQRQGWAQYWKPGVGFEKGFCTRRGDVGLTRTKRLLKGALDNKDKVWAGGTD